MPPRSSQRSSARTKRQVAVSFFVNNVSDVDLTEGTFEIDVYCTFEWYDNSVRSIPVRDDSSPEAWQPQYEIIHGRDIVQNGEPPRVVARIDELRNAYTGDMTMYARHVGTVRMPGCTSTLASYPFDVHDLTFVLESWDTDRIVEVCFHALYDSSVF